MGVVRCGGRQTDGRPAGLDGPMADTQPDQPDELVHYEVADRIATITLDSPHNRNALSRQLITELFERLDRADQDADILAVVLSAPVGCSAPAPTSPRRRPTPMEEGARAIVRLQRTIVALSKPVVTVVAGAARAGGIGIVAASDIVLTAEDATFALTEVKLGLAPAVISLTVLPRLTQRAAALTALGGEVFTGAEAVGYGLVTKAVPADQLDAAVAELCGQLATGAAQGLRETKRLLAATCSSGSTLTVRSWSPSAPACSGQTTPARRWSPSSTARSRRPVRPHQPMTRTRGQRGREHHPYDAAGSHARRREPDEGDRQGGTWAGGAAVATQAGDWPPARWPGP